MRKLHIFYIIFLTLLLSGLAEAQDIPTGGTSPDSTAAIIKQIQLPNIGTATEETLAKLRDFNNKVKVSASETELDSMITIALGKLANWQDRLNPEDIETMRVRQTEGIKIEFESARQFLESWRKSYISKVEEIIQLQEELSRMQKQWQLTLDVERQEPIPTQVIERINNNIDEISLVSKAVAERKNNLLTKQTELTSALIYVNDIISAIAKVERAYKQQLFALDMPPIWQMFSVKEDSTSLQSQLSLVMQKHKDDLTSFKAGFRGNIYGHLFFFVILLVIAYLARSEVHSWSDEKKDETVHSSLVIIDRPFSSALLIFLLSSGLFYPGVTPDVLNYFYVLIIIPLLRVIPLLLREIRKVNFYLIAVIFFLIQLGDHFSEIFIIERLFILVVNAMSVYVLYRLLREEVVTPLGEGDRNWRFARKIMRISIVIFAVSILANVIGNTFFSRVISKGTLILVFGGGVIYAGTIVLKGLFSLLIQYKGIAKLNIIQHYSEEVRRHIFRVINWLAVLYWLFITLEGYLIYDVVYEWGVGVLTNEWTIGSVSLSLGSILAFFITLWLALLLSQFIRFILQEEILTHFKLPRGVPGAISMIVRLTLIFLGFILAFGAAKIDMSNVAIVFGALGVGIGFGLQNIFNNLVSGLILAFERPVQVGDVIQISNLNLMGEVKDIGIRASIVRTFDGAEVIVPNGNLISNEMINWTLSDKRRRQEINVGVAYGTDTDKVLELLKETVLNQESVLKDPEPLILFQGFGESSLDFRVLFWTYFEYGFTTKSAVSVAIDTALKKAGIVIPFPQRDLHVISTPEETITGSSKVNKK